MPILKKLLLVPALALTLTLAACGDSGTGSSSAMNDEEFGKKVRDYILKNPKIIREAMVELEKLEEKEEKQRSKKNIEENATSIFKSASSPIAGNTKGDVTVVEYFDYNCPYCRQAFRGLETLMKADKNVKVVFKEFPIFGGASKIAAEVALASKNQGKYFETHKALLSVDKRLTEASIYKIAEGVGLDMKKLKEDMKSQTVQKEIAEVAVTARKLGIQGTPAFLVGPEMIPGAPRDLPDRLKNLVKKVRTDGCKIC